MPNFIALPDSADWHDHATEIFSSLTDDELQALHDAAAIELADRADTDQEFCDDDGDELGNRSVPAIDYSTYTAEQLREIAVAAIVDVATDPRADDHARLDAARQLLEGFKELATEDDAT